MAKLDAIKKVQKIKNSLAVVQPSIINPELPNHKFTKIPDKTSSTDKTLSTPPLSLNKLALGQVINLLGFFEPKQIITIISTFLITLVISIATSQSLAANFSNNKTELIETTTDAPRQASLAVTANPPTLSFDQIVKTKPGEVYLPKENVNLPDPLLERKEFLQKYLALKNSPLADHVDALSEQTQWKLIIAISQAESSACKKLPPSSYNCWGIGGAWDLKYYENYDQAIADVNRILEQHYIQAGLNTPKTIVNKWVGHNSPNWQAQVQTILNQLNSQN